MNNIKLFYKTRKYVFCNSKMTNFKDLLINNSKTNIYGGIELNLDEILKGKNDVIFNNFENILNNSLNYWENNKNSSVTIKISGQLSNYIEYFIKKGFYFHHSTATTLYMCKWLDNTKNNKIPKFAHHHVGIGACIINKNLEFLLIKEKYRSSYNVKATNKKSWKFVTGLIEEGESIVEATKREILEEVSFSNVDYHGLILFSEAYPNNQNISDVCFFSLCTVNSNSYEIIKIDEDELSEAKFFSLQEIKVLIENNETTVLTANTLNKIITLFNNELTFEENILNLKKGLLTRESVDLKKNNILTNYLNVFH